MTKFTNYRQKRAAKARRRARKEAKFEREKEAGKKLPTRPMMLVPDMRRRR